MNLDYLSFEQGIADLEQKISDLQASDIDSSVEIAKQIQQLRKKSQQLTEDVFSKLTLWQMVQLARHPKRPYTLDYIATIFTDFEELHGDRHFADDQALVGGLAKLDGRSVVVMGHQKGRSTQEKIARNFGMPRPEGYRKALRLMELAEKFSLPVITFIDSSGAYPGIDAEERNQSEAIAKNLQVMSTLKTPIISVVTGEGGSGGALAIGVADQLAMLQYSIYSVISPEGCASILWKDASHAAQAAEAMQVTAQQIIKLGLIDEILPEPLGGAHRDPFATSKTIKLFLQNSLKQLTRLSTKALLDRRHEKIMAMGK